jgi:hypothetical protein
MFAVFKAVVDSFHLIIFSGKKMGCKGREGQEEKAPR